MTFSPELLSSRRSHLCACAALIDGNGIGNTAGIKTGLLLCHSASFSFKKWWLFSHLLLALFSSSPCAPLYAYAALNTGKSVGDTAGIKAGLLLCHSASFSFLKWWLFSHLLFALVSSSPCAPLYAYAALNAGNGVGDTAGIKPGLP